jgi:uncharacterized membrane protein HdeD (DUF308 family)
MKQTAVQPNAILYLGLIAIAMGVTTLAVPNFTLETIILFIGVIIALAGITGLILRIRNKSEKQLMQIIQIVGISIDIIFGIVLIIIPATFVEIFIVIVGLLLILGGISQLIITLGFSPITNMGKVFIGLAIVMLIAGTVFVFNPFGSPTGEATFFGIIVTLYGLTNVILSFWVRLESVKTKKSTKKNNIELEDAILADDGK